MEHHRCLGSHRAGRREGVLRSTCWPGALGYLASDGRLFRLTPRVLDLATAYLLSNSISAVVQPTCERISAEVQEACSAAVLDGQDIVMVTHASPPRFIAVGPGVGFRLPAFCTSLGRVLLAALRTTLSMPKRRP